VENTVKKKSVVFLLSDFLESNEFDKEVSIASLRHQFYAIQVYDRSEYEPPNIGIVKFTNSETGISEWVDTANTSFKGELQNRFETNMKETKVKFELGDSYCDINIQEPYLARLASLFRKKN
jgi:hypothetical protein